LSSLKVRDRPFNTLLGVMKSIVSSLPAAAPETCVRVSCWSAHRARCRVRVRGRRLSQIYGAVVVAMVAMRVVQVAINKIVNMATVRHRLMATT
jgi:uncharacterized protein (DUF2252 family)